MFFDMFSLLCDRKGVSRYTACTDVGLNRSVVGRWKSGSAPRGDNLQKLADYFGVTTDYLLGVGDDAYYDWVQFQVKVKTAELRRVTEEGERFKLECEIDGLMQTLDDLNFSRRMREAQSVNHAMVFNAQPATGDVSEDEAELLKKYRALDGHGRKTVGIIIDRERIRAQQLREARQSTFVPANDDTENIVSFPLSVQPVSAGTGVFLGEDAFKEISIVDNYYTRRAKFALPVSGDSMEPTFHDGDIILVDGAEEIPVGKIGVFTINGEGYVKVLGKGELISLNPEYDPIPLNECTDIRCNGEVIGVLDPAWIISK